MEKKLWRPADWDKCHCDNCPEKRVDDWGYLCDIHCGKRSAYRNYEAGADAMYLAAREKLGKMAFLLDEEVKDETLET